VKRQHVDALDVAQAGCEAGDPRDVLGVVCQARHQNESKPDGPFAWRQPPREVKCRRVIHDGQLAMAFRIPCLDVEEHEIERVQLGVGDAVAVVAVRIERRVDAHGLRGRQELYREAMLHQRFSAAQNEAAGHHLETAPVLA